MLKRKNLFIHFGWFLFCVIVLTSCATYYDKMYDYQNYVERGDYEKSLSVLDSKKMLQKDRVKVLYHLNKGYSYRQLGDYESSIREFHDAEILIEDYQKKLGAEALSLISNPTVKPYKVEDFENIMVNYYQALNYIAIGKYKDALVECKRVNIKLNALNDKYKTGANRYKNDAFAHNLMGILYEIDFDYNNAFIAYRNAYEAYKNDGDILGVQIPKQLKIDLMRTAYLSGFTSELDFYEREFGQKYVHKPSENGELIVFWENGVAPIKDEFSINFASSVNGGMLYLQDKDLGLSFSYSIPLGQQDAFRSLQLLRVAFPKFVEQQPLFSNATISANGKKYDLQLVENVNEIAFKTLNDRMMRELGGSLLRLATKKAMEYAANSQNEYVGTILAITNAVSEKADTRYWQTLPKTISYARIPLEANENQVVFTAKNQRGNSYTTTLNVPGEKKKTYFHVFTNIVSMK